MKILYLLVFIPFLVQGQKIDQPTHFTDLLDRSGLEFLAPLDAGYKDVTVIKNFLQDYNFAIRSRKEKLEIRYLIEPWQENDPSFQAPHVRCVSKLMNLATNNQEVVMTGLDIDTSQLAEEFNADWGKVFFFQPKPHFSKNQHIKMLALFKEGKGMAYVFFLFDEPSRDLDNRIIALRFKEELTN